MRKSRVQLPKHNSLRKILSIVLVLILVLQGLPLSTVYATEGETPVVDKEDFIPKELAAEKNSTVKLGTQTFTYTVDNMDKATLTTDNFFEFNEETQTIVSYSSASNAPKDVIIPESINGVEVLHIGKNAFMNSQLTSLTLNSNLQTIGESAFEYSTQLTTVTIPESVTSIGDSAFSRCSELTNITIPEGITSIGTAVLAYCYKLTRITIPESVTSIGDSAFSSCSSLTSITIPAGVTSIGDNAFTGCRSLTSVTIPEGVTSIGSSVFSGCYDLTNITIPKDVTSIGHYAFSNCERLTSITIPESVTYIGNSAFDGCSDLTSITIPEGVTSIGDNTFSECSSLTSIRIPEGVTSIGDNAFSNCSSLTSITIPEGVTSIGNFVFNGCSDLTRITIPEGVTSIGNSAFNGCSDLISITIPEGVTSIGDSAFKDCRALTSKTIPKGVTSIGDSAFNGCSALTSITIPESVTSIGNSAFKDCRDLTSITILEGVTSIRDDTFANCSSLTSLTIPNSVTSIGNSAFANCSNLKTVYIGSGIKSISSNIFSNSENIETIIVDVPREDFVPAESEPWGAPNTSKVLYRGKFVGFSHTVSNVPNKYERRVDISAEIATGNISRIIMPDGTTVNVDAPSWTHTFIATENKIYTFIGVDSEGVSVEYRVNISDIGAPTISAQDGIISVLNAQMATKDDIYTQIRASAKDELDNDVPFKISDLDLAKINAFTLGDSATVTVVATSHTGLTSSKKVTITATETRSVSFETNGGTPVPSVQNIVIGEKITEPTQPVKEGHTFEGWYKEDTFVTQWNFEEDTVGINDMVLYAKWRVNQYTVTFINYNGSQIGEVQMVNHGKDATAPSPPSRPGYTFTGWDKEFANVQSDLIVTAVWKYDGGSGVIDPPLPPVEPPVPPVEPPVPPVEPPVSPVEPPLSPEDPVPPLEENTENNQDKGDEQLPEAGGDDMDSNVVLPSLIGGLAIIILLAFWVKGKVGKN